MQVRRVAPGFFFCPLGSWCDMITSSKIIIIERGEKMKKIAVAIIIIVSLLVVVSCSTTQASDVEPVVREVRISDFVTKEYTADQIYQIIERFAKDAYGDEKDVTISYDKDARSIVVKGLELSSNVGALAQDGWIVTDLRLEAKEDTAVISLLFVDSYTIIYLGPIQRKTSQGITEYGLKTLDCQAQYIADWFQSAGATYAYYVDTGTI